MRNKKGFTLIELLIVVAIIGLLATLAIISLTTAQQKARDTKRIADIKSIQNAYEMYYNDNNNYPTTVAATTWDSLQTTLASQLNAMPSPPNSDYAYVITSTTGSYCFKTQLNRDNQILDQDNDNNSCNKSFTAATTYMVGWNGTTLTQTAWADATSLDCNDDDTVASGPYTLCLGN